MSISVVLPSYKNPKYLDLCLKSILETQKNQNEIIVVIDGFVDLSKHIIDKYKDKASFLELEENVGFSQASNYGVYNSKSEYILMVNEDNVFPENWDVILNHYIESWKDKFDYILSINQIEPIGPSIYNFTIKDFGKIAEEFRFKEFIEFEKSIRKKDFTQDGSLFPFMMSKKNYMRLGGLDTAYPSAFVVDWDFFLKAELSNFNLVKAHDLSFYHFGSKSTKKRDDNFDNPAEFYTGENRAAEYFEYKWGFKPHRDENNKCKQFIPT